MTYIMKTMGYSTVFLVDKSPEEVFNAINNVPRWWSGDILGDADRLGSGFVYEIRDVLQSIQKVTEFIPGKKIVWHVTDSSLGFVRNRKEWKGTSIIFEIAKRGQHTEVQFTHAGLLPHLECYEGCSNTWGILINSNLRKFIMTGKTQPGPW